MGNDVSNNGGKGVLSGGRLSIGVISIVLSVVILFQSCAVGTMNTLAENNDSGGSAGLLMAICMLVSGIVGIATRNSNGKSGAIVTASFYIFGGLISYSNAKVYGDLEIWAILAFLFAAFFIICAVKTKKQ